MVTFTYVLLVLAKIQLIWVDGIQVTIYSSDDERQEFVAKQRYAINVNDPTNGNSK